MNSFAKERLLERRSLGRAASVIAVGFAIGFQPVAMSEVGVFATRSSKAAADWNTGSNWKDATIPRSEDDSAEFATMTDRTDDKNDYGVMMRVTMPLSLSLASVSGFRSFDLQAASGATLTFVDLSAYFGRMTLFGEASMTVQAATSGKAQRVSALAVQGRSTLSVNGGVTTLEKLTGVGSLIKTGTGELQFAGAANAHGVAVKVEEGRLSLNGVPQNLEPVDGAAVWFDASKNETLTVEGGRVSTWKDARGDDYPALSRENGWPVPKSFGPLQFVNLGKCTIEGDAAADAKWGEAGALKLASSVDCKSFFAVYRYNADVGGSAVFPLETSSGYEMRPGSTDQTKVRQMAKYRDGTTMPLFEYVQYGVDYNSFAPHCLVTADLRRNGEPVSYNGTPRGYGSRLDYISAVMNENAKTDEGIFTALDFQRLGRCQKSAVFGGSQIGEVLVYDRYLTEAEHRQNDAYLNRKWMEFAGVRDYDVDVLTPVGGELYVPAGRVARVKELDLTSAPLVKTGAGRLEVRFVRGSNPVMVQEGGFGLLPKLAPVDGAMPVEPAYGKHMHLDATVENFDKEIAEGGVTRITRWGSACATLTLEANVAAGSQTTSLDMKPALVADDKGRRWVDFGTLSTSADASLESGWMYLVDTSNSSKPLTQNVLSEIFIVMKRKAGSTRNPAVLGTANQYQRYFSTGASTILGSNPYASGGNAKSFDKSRNGFWTVNGRYVEPTEDNYIGDGVQVLHVALGESSYFNALCRDFTTSKGGAMIGEVIAYSRTLTGRERVETERYLMNKWGAGEHPEFADTPAEIAYVDYGSRAENVFCAADTTRLTALYPSATAFAKSGVGELSVSRLGAVKDVTVSAGKLTVGGLMTTAPVTAMETLGMAVHIDANNLKSIALVEGNRVAALDDVDGRALGFTPYNDSHLAQWSMNGLNGKACFDLGPQTEITAKAPVMFSLPEQIEPRSFFMVYRRYDGVYTSIASASGYTTAHKTGGSASIYDPDINQNYTTKSYISVDGVYQENGDGGYPEGLHVFGIHSRNSPNASYAFQHIGGHLGSNVAGGMYICEFLAGTNVCNTAEGLAASQEIEQYLCDKWLGAQKFDLGSIDVAAGAELALNGDLTVKAGSTLTFGLNVDGTLGKTTLNGVLSLGATGNIVIEGQDGMKLASGDYPLVVANGLDASVAAVLANWTVSVPQVKNRTLAVRARGDRIVLEVVPFGLAIVVR